MSSIKEGHDEAFGVSVKTEHENKESSTKAEPGLTADNSSNSAIPEKNAEFSSEPSENEGEEEEKEREEDYDEEDDDEEEDEASGSDYDDGKSPYSTRKESEGKNPRGGSRAAKPKRKYKKPRQRHRTDDSQLKRLEEVYQYDSNPNHEMRAELAKESGMSTRQIQVWFQNRRAKTRRDAARKQLKVRVNAVGRPPLDRSQSAVGSEGPSSIVAPPQDKQPKEPKKRSYTKRKKGADNQQHSNNNGHGHHKHDENDEKDNGDDGPKSHHYLRHKKVRVDDEYDSSSSELSSESSYSEGESSSSSSSDSYSSSESSSSDIPENDSYALQSEFSNPSYLYKKVLEYIKRNGKIDQQESEEQDLKRLFG